MQSILSILKSDCAYVPLDIGSPRDRLRSILDDTNAALVIVDSDSEVVFEALDIGIPTVNISTFVAENTEPVISSNIDIDLAYVLFTSGSTGTPKGVMIPHRAIIDYIDWCVETYSIKDTDNVANHAPLYFDNSTFDMYTAFASGATLHLVPDILNSVIPRLVKWIREHEISVFFCVPSVLTLLAISRRLKADSFPNLREVIFAGEVIQVDTLAVWMELFPDKKFTNMYGPTEITVDCSFQRVFEQPNSSVPIGVPRKNMELFVRTEDGRLSQAPAAEGELLVRGTSVAYGYLSDDEKTRAAFIQNPLHDTYPDRLYCTGDLVKIDETGQFMFIGRADSQIKFLGQRIELGEIQSCLVAMDEVIEGVVVFNHSESVQDQAIGALVALKSEISLKELRSGLLDVLPSYMVPTKIVIWDGAFPRTANGKYDNKAIAALVFDYA
jgi:amino acid adenylation domain-containing protein